MLNLNWFLLKGKVCKGDVLFRNGSDRIIVGCEFGPAVINRLNGQYDSYWSDCKIVSFADRDNCGEVPVVDGTPVVLSFVSGNSVSACNPQDYLWAYSGRGLSYEITKWKPGLKGLIEMQEKESRAGSVDKCQEIPNIDGWFDSVDLHYGDLIYDKEMHESGFRITMPGTLYLDDHGIECKLIRWYENKLIGLMHETPPCNGLPAISVCLFDDIKPIIKG